MSYSEYTTGSRFRNGALYQLTARKYKPQPVTKEEAREFCEGVDGGSTSGTYQFIHEVAERVSDGLQVFGICIHCKHTVHLSVTGWKSMGCYMIHEEEELQWQ